MEEYRDDKKSKLYYMDEIFIRFLHESGRE